MEHREYPASSNIEALIYDAEALELTALFKGDKAYAYVGVEAGVWEQLRDVKGSVGSLFAHLIRGGGYPFAKVPAEVVAALNDDEFMKGVLEARDAEAAGVQGERLAPPKRPRTRVIRKLGV